MTVLAGQVAHDLERVLVGRMPQRAKAEEYLESMSRLTYYKGVSNTQPAPPKFAVQLYVCTSRLHDLQLYEAVMDMQLLIVVFEAACFTA
jgi:hypothetical protein